MKTVITAGLALLSTFAFTSCKKDYSCVCKLNNQTVYTQNYNDVTRAEAEDKCDGDGTVLAGTAQWDCDVEL